VLWKMPLADKDLDSPRSPIETVALHEKYPQPSRYATVSITVGSEFP